VEARRSRAGAPALTLRARRDEKVLNPRYFSAINAEQIAFPKNRAYRCQTLLVNGMPLGTPAF
jgi:hypothetical protein